MQVGKYTLIRKLATGGMAEVYLARADGPMGFAKTLVLKRILPHLAEDQTFIEMFLGEAKLAAQLNHPNVVQIFDFGESDGAYFIAMEFIDGPNLRALTKRATELGQPLPLAACAKLISFACEGLAFAHDFADPETGEPLGLIHRDISPDNILLSKTGAVKVVDFGIAKAAGQGHHTKTGTLKGKLSYMPPEQLSGKPLDRRADVFALGIVLYELLCAKKPFDATTEVSIMQAILYEPLIPANQRRTDVPPELSRILDRALAKNRDERYGSCRELQADLERFILTTGEPVGSYQLAQLVAQLAAPQPAAAAKTPSNPGQPAVAVARTPSNPQQPALTPQRTPTGANVQVPPRTPSSANQPVAVAPRTPSNPALPVTDHAPPRTPSHPAIPVAAEPSHEVPLETAVTASLGPPASLAELEAIPLTAKRTPASPAPRSRAPVLVGAVGVVLFAAAAGIVFWKRTPPAEPPPKQEPVAEVKPTPELPREEPPKEEPKPLVVEAPKVVEAPPVVDAGVEVAQADPPPVQEPERGGAKKSKRGEKKIAAVQTRTETKTIIIPASGGAVEKHAEPEVQKAPALASFEVVSVPAAQVKVNGRFVSMSPAKVMNVQPGEVRVEVYDSKAGFSKAQTFNLTAGDNGQKRIVVEQGTLEFRIRPYATVFLDGKPLGQTPIPPVPVYEGTHEIRMVNSDLKVEKVVSFAVRGGANTFKFNLQE